VNLRTFGHTHLQPHINCKWLFGLHALLLKPRVGPFEPGYFLFKSDAIGERHRVAGPLWVDGVEKCGFLLGALVLRLSYAGRLLQQSEMH
jgi:hypothetical protein